MRDPRPKTVFATLHIILVHISNGQKTAAVPSLLLFIPILLICSTSLPAAKFPAGIDFVNLLNYKNCVELSNDSTRVVIGHHVGGRVLSYQLNGREALYLDPAEANWQQPGKQRKLVTAGRFDIGPEYIIPKRDILWSGRWKFSITGPRSVQLTSQPDPATGTQLIREFKLAETGSHLSCRQIIKNITDETKHWCHWSRTFAKHGGVAIVPLSKEARHPFRYVMYEGRGLINARPSDPSITQVDNFLLVKDIPKFPKLGFDSMSGWFAYQMKHDLMFVKKYRTEPDTAYNEVAGLTISIWYPKSEKVDAVELEPIGPRNVIKPGKSAEFTEHWWLMENPYQKDFSAAELKKISKRVGQLKN